MLTSGLVVQNRGYGTYPSTRTRERTTSRPYVYGFDSVPVNLTDFHNPYLKTPPTVNYQKIFGRGVTPSEKDYFMTHGKTMIQKAADGVVTGRARRGKFKSQAGTVNDSFKNLMTFDEYKEFTKLDKSEDMEGVDLFGEKDAALAAIAQRARAGVDRNFAPRIIPPATSSGSTTPSATTPPSLGPAATLDEVNRMNVDQEQLQGEPMNLGTEQDEINALADDLLRARLDDRNGGSAPVAPAPPPAQMQVDIPTEPRQQIMIGSYNNNLMAAIRANAPLRPMADRVLAPAADKPPTLQEELNATLTRRRGDLQEDEEDEEEPFE